MTSVRALQDQVGEAFKEAFGRTSLRARLQDILGEAMELQRKELAFGHKSEFPERMLDSLVLDYINRKRLYVE